MLAGATQPQGQEPEATRARAETAAGEAVADTLRQRRPPATRR
jgi:hypothetical protein